MIKMIIKYNTRVEEHNQKVCQKKIEDDIIIDKKNRNMCV